MFILLSPAKTLDYETPAQTSQHTLPRFLDDSAELIDILKQYSPEEVGALMKISPALSELNAERFYTWKLPIETNLSKQAVLAFKGDVYQGLAAETLTATQLDFAQQHLRILSGLYGILKPLDLMLPYRLEMGTRLESKRGKNLYQFWGSKLTESLNTELAESNSEVVINLASNEYFKAIQPKDLQATLVTPNFKDEKNGQYKIISFYAKKARGLMARWIIENNLTLSRVEDIERLKKFNVAGYRFSEEDSKGYDLIFKRAEKDAENA